MTSFRNLILSIASVLLLAACGSGTDRASEGSIPGIKAQLKKDSVALQALQERYQTPLRDQFRWCDSMLAFVPEDNVNEFFDVLNLAQAYLSQFDETLPIMQKDMAYIQHQLDLLQKDIDTHYINDSLAAEYLSDEKASADTLHNRVLYFEDRLSQQDQALKELKKNIGKVTKQ